MAGVKKSPKSRRKSTLPRAEVLGRRWVASEPRATSRAAVQRLGLLLASPKVVIDPSDARAAVFATKAYSEIQAQLGTVDLDVALSCCCIAWEFIAVKRRPAFVRELRAYLGAL